METKQTVAGWHLGLDGGMVQLIQIDFRLGLFLMDRTGKARLYIGTECHLKSGDREDLLATDEPASLAPILPFRGAPVNAIDIEENGRLRVVFDRGEVLEILPNESYEAWELGAFPGGKWVCSPGGKVMFFPGNDEP